MMPPLHWLVQYGYVGLFSLLVLGIIGLPIPDETLLTLAGSLAAQGTLRLVPTLTIAFLGSVCGITASYGLGRSFGHYLIEHFGVWLHITPEKLGRMEQWFEQWGKWGLLFGYFIPGVRHLVAYVAGMSELPLRVFVLFAYTGGLLWSATFITLGYILGEEWQSFSGALHRHLQLFAGVVFVVLFGLMILVWRHWRDKSQR